MGKIIIAMLSIVFLASSLVSAAVIDANTTYVSQYVWRGWDLNANQPAVQPGLTVNLADSGATLGFWGSYNIGTGARQLTELDATLDYSFSATGFDYSVGYTYYTFPNLAGAAAKSGELYAGITLSEALFSPGLTLFYDHDQGNGLYGALAAGYDFALGALGLSSGLSVGYNNSQWGATTGISDIALALSSEIGLGAVTVTPSVNYISIPSGTGVNANSSEFWFGIDVAGSI